MPAWARRKLPQGQLAADAANTAAPATAANAAFRGLGVTATQERGGQAGSPADQQRLQDVSSVLVHETPSLEFVTTSQHTCESFISRTVPASRLS